LAAGSAGGAAAARLGRVLATRLDFEIKFLAEDIDVDQKMLDLRIRNDTLQIRKYTDP
jgi:hypothetical protein